MKRGESLSSSALINEAKMEEMKSNKSKLPSFLYIFLILHRYCFANPFSRVWETTTDAAYEFPIMLKYEEQKGKTWPRCHVTVSGRAS